MGTRHAMTVSRNSTLAVPRAWSARPDAAADVGPAPAPQLSIPTRLVRLLVAVCGHSAALVAAPYQAALADAVLLLVATSPWRPGYARPWCGHRSATNR